MQSPAAELVSATSLFLRRHEEALASGDGARTLEAAEGLLAALEGTLPEEVSALRREVLGEPLAPPGAASLGSDDPRVREAWAHEALRRRVSEAEGLLLQLRLMLQNLQAGEGDAFRLVALLTALRSVLRALSQTLRLWRDALGACAGVSPSPEEPVPAWALLRAAREALLAGAPDAAAPALRRALLVGLAAPLDAPVEDVAQAREAWTREGVEPAPDWAALRALETALAAPRDVATGWAALDLVDAAVNRAGMARRGPPTRP